MLAFFCILAVNSSRHYKISFTIIKISKVSKNIFSKDIGLKSPNPQKCIRGHKIGSE